MQSDLELRIDAFLARELGTAAEEKERADEWKKRALAAEAALTERDKPCVWTLDEDNWYLTGCGSAFNIPAKFCPDCGHPIEVAE